jgi:hypothetical protein
MDRVAVDEIAALQAEVASLKLQNENLEIRLAAANDKIVSLQQFCEGETALRREGDAILKQTKMSLEDSYQSRRTLGKITDHYQEEAEKFRKELMRRGADDPRKPKPPCDTAFAALQEVSKWDRDECFADLRKQRAEHLRRIDALKSGREIQMDDVVKAMNKDNSNLRMIDDFDASLHHVLFELREQLCVIYESHTTGRMHEEWLKYPLSMFTLEADSDMEDDDNMESE